MKRITRNEIEKKPFISCENFSNFKQLVVCEPCISRLIEDKQTFGLEKIPRGFYAPKYTSETEPSSHSRRHCFDG